MRIRYLKNTEEILHNSSFVIDDPVPLKGQWMKAIPGAENKAGLCLEIGCGKGQFIRDMARKHGEMLWIGDEKIGTILARASGNLDEEIDQNVRLICWDAEKLDEIFAPGEIDRLYLNFSDPWPKDRHAKRRLTSERFLPIYARLLSQEGWLQFKTDNDDLFAFSVESFRNHGWQILEISDDLHQSPYVEGNVMTEYEQNFVNLGKNIHYLKAIPSRESLRA